MTPAFNRGRSGWTTERHALAHIPADVPGIPTQHHQSIRPFGDSIPNDRAPRAMRERGRDPMP